MITFKSTEDLAKLPQSDPAYPTIKKLVNRLITAYTTPDQPYNHEDYGYVILIQECDVNGTFDEIWDGMHHAEHLLGRDHAAGRLLHRHLPGQH